MSDTEKPDLMLNEAIEFTDYYLKARSRPFQSPDVTKEDLLPPSQLSPPAPVPSSGVQGGGENGTTASGELRAKGVFGELQKLADDYRAEYGREMPAVVAGQVMLQLLQDRGWQRQAPRRVFFPGEPLPERTVAVGEDGEAFTGWYRVRALDGPLVELHPPSREDWQDRVDRARAARKDQE